MIPSGCHAARRIGRGAGLAIAPFAPKPSHAAAKIQHLVSPGGIEAWFVQDATVPLIAMEYAFIGGATQDPADKPGVGNMVADLLDEGSGDLDSKTFHERLDRRAIELSFCSSRDHFRGSLRMLKDNRDEAFSLLRMSLTSPHFDSADVERIRSQVISDLQSDTASPIGARRPQIHGNGLWRPPLWPAFQGTLESVPKITVTDLRDYVGRVLAKDTLRIAVVGDVDRRYARQVARSHLRPPAGEIQPDAGSRRRGREAAATRVHSARRTADCRDVRRPGHPPPRPELHGRLCRQPHPRRRHLSSRLYREVREKRGLAYSVYESLLWMEHSALFIGHTGTRADRAGETVEAINEEVRRMAEDGPTQKELDEAKSYLKGSQMLALDTSSKLASAMLQYQLDKLPIDYIEKRNAIVDAVTLDQASAVAKQLWGQGLLTVMVGRTPQAAAQPAAVTRRRPRTERGLASQPGLSRQPRLADVSQIRDAGTSFCDLR